MLNVTVLAGPDQFLYEFNMHSSEAAAVMAFLIENADEIDDRMAPSHDLMKSGFVMDIGTDDLDSREYEKTTGARTVTRWHPDGIAPANEQAGYFATDESRPAEDAYGF
jgi:hypothetical protein